MPKMAELDYVLDRLSPYYTPDETRIWLTTPQALLNGEKAIDLINNGRTDEVIKVIGDLDHGTYI
jgi:uncharacterized protein (DUF2384 family)